MLGSCTYTGLAVLAVCLCQPQLVPTCTVCQAASLFLGAGLALSLALVPAAEAKSLADHCEGQGEQILAQKSKLYYAIQQQERASKAELLGNWVSAGNMHTAQLSNAAFVDVQVQ